MKQLHILTEGFLKYLNNEVPTISIGLYQPCLFVHALLAYSSTSAFWQTQRTQRTVERRREAYLHVVVLSRRFDDFLRPRLCCQLWLLLSPLWLARTRRGPPACDWTLHCFFTGVCRRALRSAFKDGAATRALNFLHPIPTLLRRARGSRGEGE